MPYEKVERILSERNVTHGSFTENARIAQELKMIMRRGAGWTKLSPTMRESLELVALKVSRILAGSPTHIDSWDDIAGYATLVANELRKNN